MYGRRGGAKSSIYLTNPTYFYVQSETDQIGPLLVLSTLQNKEIQSQDR